MSDTIVQFVAAIVDSKDVLVLSSFSLSFKKKRCLSIIAYD